MMGDHLRISCANAAKKWDTILESSHIQHLIIVWCRNHCMWYSSWMKQQPTFQQLTSSILVGSCWTHVPPSALSEIYTSFNTSSPVMQAKNSRCILTGYTIIIVTPISWKWYHLKWLTTKNPMKHTIIFHSSAQVQYHHRYRFWLSYQWCNSTTAPVSCLSNATEDSITMTRLTWNIVLLTDRLLITLLWTQ